MKEEEEMLEMEEYEELASYNSCCWDPAMAGKNKKEKNKSKRRFSDDQIKSLESMFESQTKVEPRKKMQLAKELGLQPRQVSIWFQNKRARWKSKQLETQYGALKADYDTLLSNFESLKKEKHSLLNQLKSLADLLETPLDQGKNTEISNSERRIGLRLVEKKLSRTFNTQALHEGDEEQRSINHLEKEEDQRVDRLLLPYTVEPTTEQQYNFDDASGRFSDQSCSNTSPWWEVWPLNE